MGERRSARRPGAKVSRVRRKMARVVRPPRGPAPRADAPRRAAKRPSPAGKSARVPETARTAPPASGAGLRGTPLRDADIQTGRVGLERWAPELAYRWDTGVAIGRFLEGLRAGKIVGVRCHRCGRTVTPPRAFCEWCFKPMDEWVQLADEGTINTFSICYVTWDMKPLTVPQVPAVIEIDGTTPRGGFLHLIGGLRADDVEGIRGEIRVGQRVRAVWKPAAERTGAITDIIYFTPA